MTGRIGPVRASRLPALLRQVSVLTLIVALIGAWSPQPAQARLVTVEEAAARTDAGNGNGNRDRIAALLDRPEVRAELVRQGVKPEDAVSRIAALSDAEVHMLAEEMDAMPAGGSSILGALLLVFIVLLVTDILGYTKVFSFTKPIK
jgi:hypothetical protein